MYARLKKLAEARSFAVYDDGFPDGLSYKASIIYDPRTKTILVNPRTFNKAEKLSSMLFGLKSLDNMNISPLAPFALRLETIDLPSER